MSSGPFSVDDAYAGGESYVPSEGYIEFIPDTHDVPFVSKHIPTLSDLISDLEAATRAARPRRHKSRYSKAYVLFLRWESDDLGVITESNDLQHVFQDLYHYQVESYQIPDERPDTSLKRRILQFLENDAKDTLLIVYYAGHSKRHQSNSGSMWHANRSPRSPSLACGGVQSMLEETQSDVLLLYDCCHSAATTMPPSTAGYKGVTEVISACGHETISPPVYEHSFSKALTQILVGVSHGQPFSVRELHTRVLNRLLCWTPSLEQDQDGKITEDLDGRLIDRRQPRRTPIYTIIFDETESRQSIILTPLKCPIPISEPSNIFDDAGDSIAIPAEPDTQQGSASKGKQSTEKGLNTSYDSKQQRPNEKEIAYPQVLVAIRLENDTFDEAAWLEWLRVAPPECKDVKIEGTYDSFSTLLLARMPASIWNLLPENAAYNFVGFVTSGIKVCNVSDPEIPTASLKTNTETPPLYDPQIKLKGVETPKSPSWAPTQPAGSNSDEKASTTEFQATMAGSIYSNCILNTDLYEIRVLELQPHLSASSPIKVRLSKAFVLGPPTYYALSYVWGDSSEKLPIFVDGKEFQVTKNLFGALKRLRLRNFSFPLWVDAICIDQDNIRGRNFQVQLMKDIYSRAKHVIIWLGDSEDDSDLAMDLIKAWAPPGAWEMSMPQLLEMVMSTRNGFDNRSWDAARRLFAREYWYRAWILQEIVFSNQATVWCGSKQVSWAELGIALVKWQQLKSEPENFHLLRPEQLGMVRDTYFSQVSAISLHRLQQQIVDLPRSLLQLLSYTSVSRATDPRDKIYALLGFEEVSALDLEPDYTKPVERVYTEFVQAYLATERKLDILFQTGIAHGRAEGPFIDFPSWVPDFRRAVYSLHSDHFHATEGTLAITTISKDFRKMTARGIIYDVITDVDSGRRDEGKKIRSHWLNLALNHKIKHPTGIPQLQAYFRTILADDSGFGYGKPAFRNEVSQRSFFDMAAGMMYLLGETAHKTALMDLMSSQVGTLMLEEPDYVVNFCLWHQQIPASVSRQALLAPFLGGSELGQDSQIQWPEEDDDKTRGSTGSHVFLTKQVFTCVDKSFFFTAKGYMGISYRGIQKDDVVCVLSGCDMPLIVRKIEGCYVLVGNAYIYGLMNGEVLQDIQEPKAKLEDIIFQ